MKFLFLLVLAGSLHAQAEAVSTQNFLNVSPAQEVCVFNYVKSNRPQVASSAILQPAVVYSHQIDLKTYQAEFQSIQGFIPEAFLNYFNSVSEKIYLYTGWDRYAGERTPLDSLAHEYTHYFQFVESGRDPDLHKNDHTDMLEAEAVKVQSAFRDLKICH